MNATEVHSQVIGCTVRKEGSAIEAVVTNFTTGEVPQLCVRSANGKTDWVDATDWTVIEVPADPKRSVEALQRHERQTVPSIPYVTSSHV